MALFGECNVYYYPNKQDNPYKVVMHKQKFNSDDDFFKLKNNEEQTKIYYDEGEKLLNNIARVKTKVRDYAFCNDWDYFVTFTFNSDNIDRYDLKEIKKKIGKFFNNYKNRKNPDFCYLLVPEFHADGAVHFHGLVAGINLDDLREFKLDDVIPVYIQNQLRKGQKVYDFTDFSQRFGYTTVEPIRNNDATAHYITKYITKDLVSLPLGTCCYLNSKGLKTPELVHQDFGGMIPKNTDMYENEFVAVMWIQEMSDYGSLMIL